jgi:hypothetical protein
MLDQRTLESLHEVFLESPKQIDARGNEKTTNPWEIEKVRELLEKPLTFLGINLSRCYGENFFLHDYEFLIHTDFREKDGESLNVLIPIWQKVPGEQHFVVFDQRWEEEGRTWAWTSQKNYSPNIGLPGRPFDYKKVVGLTDQPIDEELFNHLSDIPHMPREYFFGLTGKALKWKPGQIHCFDSKQLHCTAKLKVEEKLGLLLRFPLDA